MPNPGRIHSLDALRGFALLGICIVNLPLFARPWESFYQSPQDSLARLGIFINSGLFDGKFFPIFSFLFGAGMYFLLRDNAFAVIVRRLTGLALIGITHGLLLFTGDILVSYAVLGFLFLTIHKRRTKTLAVIAISSLVLAGVAYFIVGLSSQSPPSIPQTNYLGGYREVVASNMRAYPLSLIFVALYNVPSAFAMFCIGYLTMREGWIGWLRVGKLTVAVLAVGLAGNIFYAATVAYHQKHLMTVSMLALAWTAPMLSLAYVQALFSWVESGVARQLLRWLAAAGEMSLTNYLLQSALAGLIFHGYGFGLYNRYSIAGLLPFSVAIFVCEVVFSVLWLRFFHCGPAEWFIRSFARARLTSFLR